MMKCVLFALVTALFYGYGEGGTRKPGQVRCHRKVDLSVTLDASASTGEHNYQLYKEFTKTLLRRFDISPSKTHVTLSYFSHYDHIQTDFTENHTLRELDSIIDNFVFEGSTSRISLNINHLHYKYFYSPKSGVRPKGSGTRWSAVFLTDGFNSKGYEWGRMRSLQMQYYGVEMFVIHPKGVKNKMLDFMPSNPTKNHGFEFTDNIKEQNQLIDKIVKQICYGKYTYKPNKGYY